MLGTASSFRYLARFQIPTHPPSLSICQVCQVRRSGGMMSFERILLARRSVAQRLYEVGVMLEALLDGDFLVRLVRRRRSLRTAVGRDSERFEILPAHCFRPAIDP